MLPKPPQEQLRLDYGDSMANITSIPNWRDKTAQQLVTFSQENPQTAQPISRTNLQEFLRLHRLISIGEKGQPEGLVVDVISSGQLPPTLTAQAKGLISKVFYEAHQYIDTDSDTNKYLLSALIGLITIPEDQIVEFYRLAGGRKYPLFADEAEATAAQAAAILAADRLVAKSAIETRAGAASFAAAASYDAGDGAEAITAAGEAAWGAS